MKSITLQQVEQHGDSFCGPAVIKMLLSQHGVHASQKKIAEVAFASRTIEKFGMRIDQFARAVRHIAPEHTLWAKRDSNLQDLNILINTYVLACGVEWQEILCDEERADLIAKGFDLKMLDYGHYSAVKSIDLEQKTLTLLNPSHYAHKKDQVLSLDEFEAAWYDKNHVEPEDPEEAREWAEDHKTLFVIAPKTMVFPESLGLKKVRIAPLVKKKSGYRTYIENIETTLTCFIKNKVLRIPPSSHVQQVA